MTLDRRQKRMKKFFTCRTAPSDAVLIASRGAGARRKTTFARGPVSANIEDDIPRRIPIANMKPSEFGCLSNFISPRLLISGWQFFQAITHATRLN
jgi:hypothetical protein